jgi:hypothetical protein
MLCGEVFAICSEIHTNHTNSLWAERGNFSVKSDGT